MHPLKILFRTQVTLVISILYVMGNAQTMVKPDKVTLSFKSIIIEGVDGIPPLPPQPFLAKEVIAVAAPEDGPSTPIIAGEQQVTSTVSTVFLVG